VCDQSGSQSACDPNYTKTGSDTVFIEDNGKVTKIAYPDRVEGYMGKRVKTKRKMMENPITPARA
jgi:hypothetical protein